MQRQQIALDRTRMTIKIATSYVSSRSVAADELVPLIERINQALVGVATGKVVAQAPAAAPEPAVPIKKSVTNEFIICLEDGKKFKSLKRHLRTQYGMSPEEYREKWGLGIDYPMVAPNYAKARSQLAKEMGLGQQRRRRIPLAVR